MGSSGAPTVCKPHSWWSVDQKKATAIRNLEELLKELSMALLQSLIQLQIRLLEIRNTLFRASGGISKIEGLQDEGSMTFEEYLGAHVQNSVRLCVVLAQAKKTASNLNISVKYMQRILKGMY